MTNVQIAQLVGLASALLLFALDGFIVIHSPSWRKTGRIASLWIVIYIFFLTVLRVISYYNLATMEQLRIISGWSTLIPLLAVVSHLFLAKKIIDGEKEIKAKFDNIEI